jgi:hypothetical protein
MLDLWLFYLENKAQKGMLLRFKSLFVEPQTILAQIIMLFIFSIDEKTNQKNLGLRNFI